MVDPGRARRLAGRIKQIVATSIEMQVKDPRLGMVTITDVQVTGDLHDATVFYTVLGDELEVAESAAALESAKGVLRSEVGRRTGVRFTPTLRFQLDSVPDTARQIDELLAVAAEADARLLQVREGAAPAGDPDPYRKPRTVEPEPDGHAGGDAGRDLDLDRRPGPDLDLDRGLDLGRRLDLDR